MDFFIVFWLSSREALEIYTQNFWSILLQPQSRNLILSQVKIQDIDRNSSQNSILLFSRHRSLEYFAQICLIVSQNLSIVNVLSSHNRKLSQCCSSLCSLVKLTTWNSFTKLLHNFPVSQPFTQSTPALSMFSLVQKLRKKKINIPSILFSQSLDMHWTACSALAQKKINFQFSKI